MFGVKERGLLPWLCSQWDIHTGTMIGESERTPHIQMTVNLHSIVLERDASTTGLGAALLQERSDGKVHHITHASRS